MAAVVEQATPYRPPFHTITPYTNSSQPNMFDYPVDFNNAQLEAKNILAHVLTTLKEKDSKYYPRYGKWVERHPRLEEVCFRCIRPQVWTFLNGKWSVDALKCVGVDLRFDGKGVYLNGVVGLDRNVRIYIGQASQIRARVARHLNFRYRRDNPSLHYHAMQQSTYNIFGLAAQLPSPNMGNHALPGMDAPDLLLNVLEMWMCLVFRTLPLQVLEQWLPDDGTINKKRKEGQEGEYGGLNIATPIDHGEKQREWIDLSESEDPLVHEYLRRGRNYSDTEQKKRSDVQLIKLEDKKGENEAAQKYTKQAKDYNKARKQQDESLTPGGAFILGSALGGSFIFVMIKLWQSRKFSP